MSAGSVVCRPQSTAGRTALFLACLNGHEHVASFLLEKGAFLGTYDKQCSDELMVAACRGHMGVVRLILRRAPAIGWEDDGPHPALPEAVKRDQPEMLKLLITESRIEWTPDIRDPLLESAVKRRHWRCQQVIEVGQAGLNQGVIVR